MAIWSAGRVQNTEARASGVPGYARSHKLTLGVGIVALVYLITVYLLRDHMLNRQHGPLGTANMLRAILIGIFFTLLVFGESAKYTLFQNTHRILVPLTAGLILLYFQMDAAGADTIAHEDMLIEDLSVVFLGIGVVALGYVALALARSGHRLAAVAAGAIACVFFVIAGEEISWMQRVFQVESTEFFLERNSQGEMNLHNLRTGESEQLYYLGGFVLLALLPWLQEPLGRLLSASRLSSMRVLLPPYWLIVPFIVAGAFVRHSHESMMEASTLFISIGSVVLMIGVISRAYREKQWLHVASAAVALVLFLSLHWYFMFYDAVETGTRNWVQTEYHEFFIAWGIAAYGVSVLAQLAAFRAGQQP